MLWWIKLLSQSKIWLSKVWKGVCAFMDETITKGLDIFCWGFILLGFHIFSWISLMIVWCICGSSLVFCESSSNVDRIFELIKPSGMSFFTWFVTNSWMNSCVGGVFISFAQQILVIASCMISWMLVWLCGHVSRWATSSGIWGHFAQKGFGCVERSLW